MAMMCSAFYWMASDRIWINVPVKHPCFHGNAKYSHWQGFCVYILNSFTCQHRPFENFELSSHDKYSLEVLKEHPRLILLFKTLIITSMLLYIYLACICTCMHTCTTRACYPAYVGARVQLSGVHSPLLQCEFQRPMQIIRLALPS